MKKYYKNNTGFTLVELLIAMSIVGIIAALTIPSLIRDNTRRSFEVSVSKMYSDLLQATSLAEMDTGKNDLSKSILFYSNNPKYVGSWVKKFLRVSTEEAESDATAVSGATGCFADTYRSVDASATVANTAFCTHGNSFELDSNACICAEPMDTATGSALIYIDTNGIKDPNIAGLDFFRLNIHGDTSVQEDLSGAESKDKCASSAVAAGCFTRVIDNHFKIDYY